MSVKNEEMKKSALISGDDKYRYSLWRQWDNMGGCVNFIMLNPSTADDTKDDPTIRKCIGFAKRWGYGSISISNLFAWRSTDPKVLRTLDRNTAVGPENDFHLRAIGVASNLVVCAWGAEGYLHNRQSEVVGMLRDQCLNLHYIRMGAASPCHPLYLPYELVPQRWNR
jgi:hypothetical protein